MISATADDPAGALPFLRKAGQMWTRASAPYDAARVGVLRGRALARLGDADASRRELEVASDCFRSLGARPAADEVSALLAPASSPAGLTPREVEVLVESSFVRQHTDQRQPYRAGDVLLGR